MGLSGLGQMTELYRRPSLLSLCCFKMVSVLKITGLFMGFLQVRPRVLKRCEAVEMVESERMKEVQIIAVANEKLHFSGGSPCS